MADNDIEEIDFDDGDDVQEYIEYEEIPSANMQSTNARRELEKRLEMKRLREQLEDDF